MPMLIVEGHSQFLIPLTTTGLLAQQLHSPLQQQKLYFKMEMHPTNTKCNFLNYHRNHVMGVEVF